MSLASRLILVRAGVATRRAARARRRQLERDLACYATPAEQDDLLAILDEYPDGVTYELREILFQQAQCRALRNWRATRPETMS
jgi:hypothetical protein